METQLTSPRSNSTSSINGLPPPSYLSEMDIDFSKYPLPSHWNTKDKYSYIELSRHSMRAHYTGPGKSDGEAASVRANNPINPQYGIYYFEIQIVSRGRDGYIGIGFCASNVSLGRLPGWEPNSYGYHGDDGNIFYSSGTGKAYGPNFTTGDVVGCGINFINNTCFFTKNGVYLGIAFNNVKGLFYPSIGLRTPGEIIESNFGQKPFCFDIDHYVKTEKNSLFEKIQETSLGDYNQLNGLILSYLIHHGYKNTAKAFASLAFNGKIDNNSFENLLGDLSSIEERQEIRELIHQGNVEDAIKKISKKFPEILKQKNVIFRLECQKFLEILAQKTSSMEIDDSNVSHQGILSLGKSIYDRFFQEEENQTFLIDLFSLLAYPDPFKSPAAYMLTSDAREEVANLVNSAIL
ncbi:SPRY-domain-containing protein, partial [Rozella allomycis CSF55]